jgi:hypothetical protein
VAWGGNNYGQIDVPLEAQSRIGAIAAGGSHTVVLVVPTAPAINSQPLSQTITAWQTASFAVIAAGYALSYQWRKDGVDIAGATSATYVLPLVQTSQAGNYTVVVSNGAGSETSEPAVLTVNALAARGTVVAWGGNDYGQTTVPVEAQSGVVAIAAGYDHTVALKADGSVIAWGGPYYSMTLLVPAHSGVTAIAPGGYALKNDGSVIPQDVPAAVQTGVMAIAPGVALKTNGSVVVWAGNSDITNVPIAAQSGVTAIAVGGSHIVALKNDGSAVAWGRNYEGQTDVLASAQGWMTAISAGGYHTLALRTEGSVVAWGAVDKSIWTHVDFGQARVPIELQNGKATAVAAGWYHSVALKTNGTVVAWGANDYGQTTVPGAAYSEVIAIAAGGTHTVALLGTAIYLQARSSGNELILSWPTNALRFKLQSTSDLTPHTTWTDFANPPAVIGGEFIVTNAFSGTAQYYRLTKP